MRFFERKVLLRYLELMKVSRNKAGYQYHANKYVHVVISVVHTIKAHRNLTIGVCQSPFISDFYQEYKCVLLEKEVYVH